MKDILIGDENIRSLSAWDSLLSKNNLSLNHDSLNYIRFFYPIAYKDKTIEEVFRMEQIIQHKSSVLKKWFFFRNINNLTCGTLKYMVFLEEY